LKSSLIAGKISAPTLKKESTMANIIGPDVSFYQDLPETPQGIDFVAMRKKTNFVIIRAGQNLWPDPTFKINWTGAKRAGLARGSYWFYDSRADPKRQAELYFNTHQGDLGELLLFADFEEAYHGPYSGWRKWFDFLERLRTLVGQKEIGIYTSFYYWRDNAPAIGSENLEYFHRYPLWIAHYGVPIPNIPKPWGPDEWLFWQFTEGGDGASYGVESGGIDLNYFHGDIVKFAERFHLEVPPTPPPTPLPEIGINYKVTAIVLNVRSGPGIQFDKIGSLAQDEIVKSIDVNEDGTWIKIQRSSDGLTGWCFAQYLVPTDEPTPPPPPTGVKYIVTVAVLNIRDGPGLGFNKIGTLGQGEIVDFIEANTDGTWLKIKRSDGLVGWSFSQYLAVYEEPPPPIPPPQTGHWYRVNANTLYVREAPSSSSRALGFLQRNDIVVSYDPTGEQGWIRVSRVDGLTGWSFGQYLVSLGDTIPSSVTQKLFNGVTYQRRERTTPRKIVTHALIIDKSTAQGLQFLVTPPLRPSGPPLCTRKTSQFLDEHNLQIAINGDGFFYTDPATYPPAEFCPNGGDPLWPLGFAASRGTVYNKKLPGRPILYINQNNAITFDQPQGTVFNAISGDRILVKNGQRVSGLEASSINPRTAFGLSKNSLSIILVVVDGRETSLGATFPELADMLISFGAYTAMSFDGGGSSTMVVEGVDGSPHVVNTPVDDNIPGRERPVANHLGIFVRRQ